MHLKSDETMSMPVLISLLLLLTACQGSFRAKEGKPIELIETWPVETPMDLPELADAEPTWLDMIDLAKERIDIGQFYVQTRSDTSLDRVLKALESAAKRGVKIRFLVDEAFVKRYPEDTGQTVARIATWPNTEVKVMKRWAAAGGVQHCKYFIVDGKEAFLGSQNFDWRALEHIVELGVRIRSKPLVATFLAVFEDDWTYAFESNMTSDFDRATFKPIEWQVEGETQRAYLLVSPSPGKSLEELWDLPTIVRMIDEAEKTVQLTSMNYRPRFFSKEPFTTIQDALIRAAQRGVKVRVMGDDRNRDTDWGALVAGGVEAGEVKIPQHSSGAIPYARLTHAKFMVVDQSKAWIGTANIEGDYFFHGRNLTLVLEAPALARQLHGFFMHYWNSSYNRVLQLRDTLPQATSSWP
jgi:phosphatidylserine/phosphatidylglycerophosphate/cardiolipin synthase-like enzyme